MERFKEQMRRSYEHTFTGFDKSKTIKQVAIGWTAICLLYAGTIALLLKAMSI